MVCARFRTIVGTGRFCRLIIRGIAIREAVRHDEIHHVILRKPLKLSQRRGAGSERQFERRRSLRRCNSADRGSRLRVSPDLQRDKKIVPARRSLRARDAESWQIARQVVRFQVGPEKQQHPLWRESPPQVRRFAFWARDRRLVGRLMRTGQQGRGAATKCDKGKKREKSSEKSLRRKIP